MYGSDQSVSIEAKNLKSLSFVVRNVKNILGDGIKKYRWREKARDKLLIDKKIMNKKSNRVVYFNGEFIPESEAKVSIYDSSLMFGDMVLEMTRSFKRTF